MIMEGIAHYEQLDYWEPALKQRPPSPQFAKKYIAKPIMSIVKTLWAGYPHTAGRQLGIERCGTENCV